MFRRIPSKNFKIGFPRPFETFPLPAMIEKCLHRISRGISLSLSLSISPRVSVYDMFEPRDETSIFGSMTSRRFCRMIEKCQKQFSNKNFYSFVKLRNLSSSLEKYHTFENSDKTRCYVCLRESISPK